MSGVTRGAFGTVFALAVFFCADCLIFRVGWYNAWLEPLSSTGFLESQLHWLRSAGASGVPEVLLVGDSRIAEGFSSETADTTVNKRLHFWNFGLAGTTPRVWYYVLRDADPTRRRFAAIVIAIEDYSDRGWADAAENRIYDENFLAMRLGFGDCATFAASIEDADVSHRAMFNCLFRGVPETTITYRLA